MIFLCLSFCHQLNQSEFQDMDDETRAQYEGFRPGVYVRVEVRLLCYFVHTISLLLSLSLLGWGAMGVPSGANSRPTCAKVRISWRGVVFSGLISFAA